MKQGIGLVAVICFLTSFISAQNTIPAAKKTAVKAAHLVDVKAGRVLDQQIVLITGDKIEKVGPASELSMPAGATIIDLGSATVLPGLIDSHVHLTSDPEHSGLRALEISVPREALTGAKNARLTLEAGFTTVRNVGASGYSDVALRQAIDAGELPGPRLVASGPALGITGGHCDQNRLAPEFAYRDAGVADGVSARAAASSPRATCPAPNSTARRRCQRSSRKRTDWAARWRLMPTAAWLSSTLRTRALTPSNTEA
jgi:imidazolonepropionase-like amidohydrolase